MVIAEKKRPWRHAGWLPSNHKILNNFSALPLWSSADCWYVFSVFLCRLRGYDLRGLNISNCNFSITGTLTSFDYSKSTFTCEGDGKEINFGFLSARYQVDRPLPAYNRLLSSTTNFHGCIRRCCRLKWCKYAFLSRHKCYPSSCGERPCRRLRKNDAHSSSEYKTGFTTAAQGILKLDLHSSFILFSIHGFHWPANKQYSTPMIP